jgi:hypothetical protein
VSNVWETRYRLLVETLENIVARLGDTAPGTSSLESNKQMVRVIVGVLTLLKQHRVNKRGQCRYCGWTQWYWRFFRTRPQCTVVRSLDFALRQPVEVVIRLGSTSDQGLQRGSQDA